MEHYWVAMGGVWSFRSCVVVVALVLVWGSVAQAVQFEVSARTTKCIAEEIQNHVVVVGDYKIVHSDESHKITVKVCGWLLEAGFWISLSLSLSCVYVAVAVCW